MPFTARQNAEPIVILSETAILWSASTAIAVVVVALYVVRFARRTARDQARKGEAAALGIDRPALQYPFIDESRCIGCGACVRACPEGDVLGVVGGTAVVINGLRCVGHGRCEEECPVGAIEVGAGDLRARPDIPLLGESQRTSVPGIYIAGELSGLALVRNAVTQGRKAVSAVVEDLPQLSRAGLDLVIVGAGPAGMSAALAAAERGLRFAVLEKEPSLGGSILHYPRRKMVLTQTVDLSPWGTLNRAEYSKEHLLDVFEQIHREKELPVRYGTAVTAISKSDRGVLLTTGGETLEASAVILALGRRGTPRRLDIPGEELPKVMYQLVDAASYRNERILVVGGGDSAVEAAIGLAQQPGNQVTLSYRREKLLRIKQKNQSVFDRLLAEGKLSAMFSSEPRSITDGSVVLATPAGEVAIPNDYVFIFAGGVPPFDLVKGAGVQFGGDEAPRRDQKR